MIIDENGAKWYKGNLHMHTTCSDGEFSPREAAALYKNLGYDFIALTDHFYRNEPFEYEGMPVFSGAEYDVITNGSCYHVVGYFLKETPRLVPGCLPQEMADEIKRCGGVATLAHPAWSLQKPHEMPLLKNIDCTEIYNSVSGYPFSPRPYSGTLIDVASMLGFRAVLTAVDDTHHYREDAGRGFVYVKAEECTEEALQSAILKGDVLPTQGPFVSSRVEDGYFKVHIPDGCEHVQFFSSRCWNPDTTARGGTLYDAAYKIKSNDTFVRAEIVGFDGKTAYTQYHYVDGGQT